MGALNIVSRAGLLMHELSHLRWDITGRTKMHWTTTQELLTNTCKIINSGGERINAAGIALVYPVWPKNAFRVQTCK